MMENKIGARLKSLREEKKLTQVELASVLQIATRTIWQLEAGRVNPRADTLILYADYFGVSTDYILCGKEGKDD